MRCKVCGRESPHAAFCTWCGADQASAAKQAVGGRRADHFAAHPNESVLSPSVMTTLLPHLGHRNVQEYRWALVGGVAVLLLLWAAGLVTAAIIVAAVLVPVVYVMYLYEVSVWRDAPLPVLGLTIGGGFVLGIVSTLLINAATGDDVPGTSLGAGVDVYGLLLPVIVLPLIQEAIKPLPALLLRGRFPERLDGLVFGVAAGLGYAAAQSIVHFSAVITTLPVRTDPANWIYPLITIAVLMPLLHGSATGAITAALWRIGRGNLPRFAIAAIAAAVVAHMLFVGGDLVLTALGASQLIVLGWQILVVAALLIFVRLEMHHALLDEAANMGVARTICANCGSDVAAAGFCPVCGMALSAAPKDERSARREIDAQSQPEGA
ncbi:MAG: PrsW family intramembrane metalloprotease [Chloroflexota bacterium]|nr:PrsW family intramembrane metalloprotease [Chloroflexota bacterium]